MQLIQGPLAAVLSLSLAATPFSAAAEPAADSARTARAPYRSQLQGDQRIVHALNRFTFGPRPGDLDAVRAQGLDQWFEQQLHPAAIADAGLATRLAQFPALQWNAEELLFRLPSNGVIRQVIEGKLAMPKSGLMHAVYADQVARVKARQQEQKKTQAAGNVAAASEMNAMAGAEGGADAMTARGDAAFDAAAFQATLALAPRERVQRLIALPPDQANAFFKGRKGPQRAALVADMSADLRLTVEALENPERAVVEELMAERLTRDIYANAQLQEVMTDFWLNHFNVYLRKNEATPYYLVSYERDVIRPRALGKFEDLLEAVAHSPAMLIYLDNAQSIGPDSMAAERAKRAEFRGGNKNRKAAEGLNENYARELMELHTLGVNGGYTQADVIQAARILTGWTVDRPQRGGGFVFDERRHEPGTKKVLGQKFKEHGEREGRELLHMLATRPATAQFLSRKLAVRFVSDDPPQALVDRMAKTYLTSGGDVAAVLRTMYRSPEFWTAEVYRAKVKTPLEYVASAARASGAEITNFQPLAGALRNLGMPLYGCIPPTGYKWDAADWVSTGALVNRMNFALALAGGRLNGVNVQWSGETAAAKAMVVRTSAAAPDAGLAAAAFDPGREEARLEPVLTVGGVSDTTRAAVLQQFAQQGGSGPSGRSAATPVERGDQVLAGLLLGSPEFQRR